jgi:hypothetical protein
MIERLGHRVSACVPSADGAKAALERHTPDLAFLDIHLEGDGDGIEIGRILHDRLKVPFVYASAFTDPETREKAMTTSPLAFLSKPIGLEAVRQACDSVMA